MLKRLNKGATMIEYALIASLIAVVAITVMKNVGNSIKAKMEAVSTELDAAGSGSSGDSTV